LHREDHKIPQLEKNRYFATKLDDVGKKMEYIELENGGHSLSIQANRHAVFKAMGRFFKTVFEIDK